MLQNPKNHSEERKVFKILQLLTYIWVHQLWVVDKPLRKARFGAAWDTIWAFAAQKAVGQRGG